MKRYLCPICDQELTAKSYCPNCRKMVKKPVIYDGVLPNEDTGNYFLNHREMHPDRACVETNRERVCETRAEKNLNSRFSQTNSNQSAKNVSRHSDSSRTVYQSYRGGQSTAPGSQIWRFGMSGGSTYSSASSNRTARKTGKKGCGSGCLTVIIVLWIIGFLGGILGDIVDEIDVDSWFEEEYVPDTDGYAEVYPDSPKEDESEGLEMEPSSISDENGYVELDYNELLAEGERCNGYWHYPLSGDLVYDELMIFAEEKLGLSMTDQFDYMSNQAEDGQTGGYTYYDYCHYWDWADGYFSVGSDSVTGETHYVYAYGSYADQAIEIVLEAFRILEDEESVEIMKESLYDAIDQKDITDGYFFDMGNSSVWIYQNSENGTYMVEVSPVTE